MRASREPWLPECFSGFTVRQWDIDSPGAYGAHRKANLSNE
jgi:hypothetical protein